MSGSYLGPKFNDDEIINSLKKLNAKFSKLEDRNLINFISQKISEQKCIGWFQGRMEFGPRALGSRSILADPRDGKMQKNLNTKIKFRESFRPFAPCIPVDDLNDWFDLNTASPYMLLVAEVLNKHIKDDKTSLIPAVTHIDYSARVQTVDKTSNSRLYDLLKKFKEITGCPILINTSFNLRGEPMVCTVEDAFRTFMISDLDYLICENFLLAKDEQIDRENYLKSYTVKLD